jgi:3-dehydroquinate dehydratase
MIVVAMGERFSLSRAIFPLLGSYLTFATPQHDPTLKSAVGQRSIEDYRSMYRAMGLMI